MNNNTVSVFQIISMLLYQQRSWYVSGSPVTFKQYHCGCDAITMVIEPVLSNLFWPSSKNGDDISQQSKHQAAELLIIYIESLVCDRAAIIDITPESFTHDKNIRG